MEARHVMERLDSRVEAPAVAALATLALPDPFPMHRGGMLHGARLAYETWGHLDAARGNAILLFTGLSPSSHAAATLTQRQ